MAWKVCIEHGCPELTEQTRCPQHQTERERAIGQRRRATHGPGVHGTQAWRNRSSSYRAANPTCIDCGAASTQADHVIPRAILVAAGIVDPDHPRWLQPLCTRCHSRKTATIDKPLLAALRDGGEPDALAEQCMSMQRGA
jgi:5-methylcytosine-specific restriction endonuclease McrA